MAQTSPRPDSSAADQSGSLPPTRPPPTRPPRSHARDSNFKPGDEHASRPSGEHTSTHRPRTHEQDRSSRHRPVTTISSSEDEHPDSPHEHLATSPHHHNDELRPISVGADHPTPESQHPSTTHRQSHPPNTLQPSASPTHPTPNSAPPTQSPIAPSPGSQAFTTKQPLSRKLLHHLISKPTLSRTWESRTSPSAETAPGPSAELDMYVLLQYLSDVWTMVVG